MTLDPLKARQLDWAKSRRIRVDSQGYVRELGHNFFRPLCDDTRRDFARGSGGELTARNDRRPKLHALHSSAALVCNAFEYWRTQSMRPVISALKLPASILEMRFEAQFPTGLEGKPPNLDVAMDLRDGSTWAIESKFTEPFGPRKDPRKALREKYFPDGVPIWTNRGLPLCGSVAARLRAGEGDFHHLDAVQLLKHILGLHTCRRRFTLVYMWLDMDSDAGRAHRTELANFSESLKAEVPIVSLSYQEFSHRLRAAPGPTHDEYFEYMRSRYLD